MTPFTLGVSTMKLNNTILNGKLTYNIKEAADLLGISQYTMRKKFVTVKSKLMVNPILVDTLLADKRLRDIRLKQKNLVLLSVKKWTAIL